MARTLKTAAKVQAPVVAKKTKGSAKKTPKRMDQLEQVASAFKGWAPARDVLTEVSSVPTIFPQFDVATRVMGYPVQRIVMVHGPSNEGKTHFVLGLLKSFLLRGHYGFLTDAEMTTPGKWVRENLGALADSERFFASRPKNYEETADGIRSAAENLKKMRDKGQIDPDVLALFAVDSIQKLVPQDFRDRLAKEMKKKSTIDPYKGRGGMIQAAMNTAWMRELVPLLYHCNAGLVLISREAQNPDAGMYEKDYKVGGGNAIYYDSSLVIRVTRNEWITKGSDENKVVIGERHLGQIMKTKVGHKDAKVSLFYFNTSNGKHTPAGFDLARDVLELGLRAGVVIKHSSNALTDNETGDVYGKNMNDAVEKLSADQQTLDDLHMRVLAVAQPEETSESAV